MKLLGRKKDNSDSDKAAADAEASAQRAGTAPKGRPTPKRDQGKRGPVAPAPMTAAEARRRRKETGAKLTREEKKAASAKRNKKS